MKQVLILIAVIAVAALLSVTLPLVNGKPLVNLDMLRADMSESVAPLMDKLRGQQPEEQVQMYRWRGSNGSWQFGEVPPVGVEAEPVTLEPTRVVPSEQFKQGKY